MKKWFLHKLGGAAPPPYKTEDPTRASPTSQAELIESQEKELREIKDKYEKLQATVGEKQGKEPTQITPAAQPEPSYSGRHNVLLNTCILSKISEDALFCIADYLSPVALLSLSHTCKDLKRVLAVEVKRQITQLHHHAYLQLLCKDSLSQYPCLNCNDVHHLNLNKSHIPQQSNCWPQDRILHSSIAALPKIHPGHLQLACRISNNVDCKPFEAERAFMRKLISTFKAGTEIKMYERSDTFTAEARIHSETFILRRQLKRRYWNTNPESTFGQLQVCPHQSTAASPLDPYPLEQYQRPELRQMVTRVQRRFERRDLGNCPVCATDWTVYSEVGYVILTVYQILGTASADSYQYWAAQHWNNRVPLARMERPRTSPRLLYELDTSN